MIEVAADLRARALEPHLRFVPGGLAAELATLGEPYLLLSQDEPLAAADPAAREGALAVARVDSLELEALERLAAGLPAAGIVVGIGGGMVMDAAKYVAWQRGIRLVLVPSIVSVDACVTNRIAVRTGGGVEYRGFVVADAVVVDAALIRAAPARLNRAGVGDLLSIHTALWDWRAGAAAGSVTHVASVAARAGTVLDGIDALADEIGAVTPRAVESIVRAYAEVNALCLEVGHSQPEEGSEHYLAYRVETLTGRSFVHGELVGLATVLMAELQANDPGRPRRVLDRSRVAWRPGELGLDRATLVAAMTSLPAFVRDQRLPHSIVDEADLPARADDLVSTVLDRAG
jgi:glycerol-1-phosphate dehydrogenase [NAD(P)+]